MYILIIYIYNLIIIYLDPFLIGLTRYVVLCSGNGQVLVRRYCKQSLVFFVYKLSSFIYLFINC